jgi:hypothetical protein
VDVAVRAVVEQRLGEVEELHGERRWEQRNERNGRK